MNREEDIIRLYLTIDGAFKGVTEGQVIRQCGRQPNLTDAEAITIEVFGEMQRLHDDAAIWRYADAHWRDWFPKLGSYKAYVKQIANLPSGASQLQPVVQGRSCIWFLRCQR